MTVSPRQFQNYIIKLAQSAAGDNEDSMVGGQQTDDVPALLQPDDGSGRGPRDEYESFSSGAEDLHEKNREGGYLQGAFTRFDSSAKETGKELKGLLTSFGPDAIVSRAPAEAGATKTGSAMMKEIRRIKAAEKARAVAEAAADAWKAKKSAWIRGDKPKLFSKLSSASIGAFSNELHKIARSKNVLKRIEFLRQKGLNLPLGRVTKAQTYAMTRHRARKSGKDLAEMISESPNQKERLKKLFLPEARKSRAEAKEFVGGLRSAPESGVGAAKSFLRRTRMAELRKQRAERIGGVV